MPPWKRSELVGVVLIASVILFPVIINGQGYGSLNDDDFGSNQQNHFSQNQQQASSLPQYDSVEQQGNYQPATSQQGGRQNNLWWQGQNAFQKPAGHPGVEQLAPNKNSPPPQQSGGNYNYGQPTQSNYNPYGSGSPAPQQPPQYNNPAPSNPPTQQFPRPGPGPQQPAPSGYDPQPQAPSINNPVPGPPPYTGPSPSQPSQQPSQENYGWNAPDQNYQSQPGFGYPEDPAPGCELLNKADCHKNQNVPARQPQNYEPPPPPLPPVDPGAQPQDNSPRFPPPDSEPSQSYQPQQPGPNSPFDPRPSSPQPQPPRQPYTPPQAPRPRPQPQPQQPRPNQPQNQVQTDAEAVPYPGCPAAMLCVQDNYCNAIGVIEENPVQLSAADRLYRVALVQCSEPMTGVVGVCCRDPNYVDPWPDMQGGMMKKDQHHHHGNKGGKSPSPQQQQPPRGNNLGGGPKNPYSGQGGLGSNNYGWNRNRKNIQQCNGSSG